MENMKKLSEVCKITGVTRRALQIYEDMDLLKPTAKTECGYWLYDDEAISKIICIIIFKEAGYELKEIKKILNYPKFDFSIKANEVITKLEAKKKEITGFINYLKSIKVIAEMPEKVISAMPEVDFAEAYENKTFDKKFEEARLILGNTGEIDFDGNKPYFLLACHLIFIGELKTKSIDNENVQALVEEAYKNIKEVIKEVALKNIGDEVEPDKLFIIARDFIKDFILRDDFKTNIEIQCGEDAIDFIIQSVDYYYDNLNLS